MVTVKIGDMFDSQAQTLVNTVNCVGVMGKGIALGFKNRFPEMFKDYVSRCDAGEVHLGQPYLYKMLLTPWILNFPTKDHWRSVTKLSDIEQGLDHLKVNYQEWGITSLAIPPLGCGEGRLEWRIVGPTLYRYFNELDIPVELFAPFGTPQIQLDPDFLAQSPEFANRRPSASRIPAAWIAVVEALARIENEPYHWPVGRTILQKLAYFATNAGLPTELNFAQGSFGPYSPDLKGRITQLVNNGLIKENRTGKMFLITTGSTFEDARTAYQDDIARYESIISKITDLFLRMSTRQAEAAASVHFAAQTLFANTTMKPSEQNVLDYVMDWKRRRKPPLIEEDVAAAIRNLALLGWIEVSASPELPVVDEFLVEA